MKKNCSDNRSTLKKLWATKTFRSMRLTLYALLIAAVQALAADGYAQATKLSLTMSNSTVKQVLSEIEDISEFYFLYNSKLVDVERKVDVNFKNKKINEALDMLFKDSGVKYNIVDRQIVLSGTAAFPGINPVDQQRTVTGTVTDNTGQPLPGVTIVVKGTMQGVVTDANGNYSISNLPENATLQFSFVGMRAEEVVVGNQTRIDVEMVVDAIGIEEVVAIGYGTQKKINLTGSVDEIEEKQISNRAVTNVTEALQGTSPNLNISTGQMSNEPGGTQALNIRGVGSLTGDYSPYILVDGMPMDMNLINPEDIASITVLKDAAASAIYGSRAAYGVILIKTKSGKLNEGVKITYSNNISFSSPMGLSHAENTLKYMTAFDQASVNAGQSPNFTPENYERVRQYMAGEITDETWLKDDESDWHGNNIWDVAGNGNNDWKYIYYDNMVLRQKHDVNLVGGGDKFSYFISTGYWDQPGELRYGDEFYKRYNITTNFTSKATDWLTFNLNAKYINEHTQLFSTNSRSFGSNFDDRMLTYSIFNRQAPFRPLYLPNGEFSNVSLIPMLIEGGKEKRYNTNYLLSLGAAFEPVKDWVTKITYNYKNDGNRTDFANKAVSGTLPDGSSYVMTFPLTSYETTFGSDIYQMFNIVSSYHKTFNEHYFSLLGGYENELNKYNSLWGKKNDILVATVPSISTSTGTFYIDDSKSHWATEGFFGRFNYNYKEKYLVEVNARYDGSSRFQKESRWGFFPSVSAGYNISKEEFWSSIEPYINSLKIRGSWGSLGNQNVPNYLYLSTLGINTNLSWIIGSDRPNYTTAPGLISPDLTWETSTTSNIGLDIGFLDGKLNSSIDIYRRITTNMFGPAETLPGILGTDVPKTNNATLKTNGFELAVTWKDNIRSNLSYNIRATLADNVSIVTKFNNPTNTLSTWYEGAKLGDIWGLTTVGLYQSDTEAVSGPDQSLFYPTWGAGDIHYKDLDGDNKITRGNGTADTPGDYSIIGNNSPRFLTGLTLGLEYKGFDFNMFWQGVLKRDYGFQPYDRGNFYGFCGDQWWGTTVIYKGGNSTIDYWRPADETNIFGPNTDAYYAKPYLSKEDFKNKQVQSRFTQNANYFRLKNLSVGYTLSSAITKRTPISKARIYISGENLITLTPLTKLIDPEMLVNAGESGVGSLHPLRKVYSVGINVTF